MYSARRVNFFPTLAVLLTLTVTGCMPNASAGSGSTTAAAASPSAPSAPESAPAASAPSAAASPPAAAPAASSQPPAPAGTPPSSDQVPAAAEPVAFTFPDGRLSFTHPAGWYVDRTGRLEPPSVENATVYDAGGNEQVHLFYSEAGGANMGPLTRTVLYSEPVPGLLGHSAPAAHASFFVDNIYGELHYRMAITAGPAVSPDGKPAADATIVGGNRVLAATVIFTGPSFASDEAARAWLAGGEGQALTDLLMSFTYR
ncbi:hypothetical protein [Arthrobacter sp. AD-310]